MKFSKAKIIVFFVGMLVLSWFLYPRELFLGFIYEGTTDLKQSEAYYQKYLEHTSLSKFATLHLASLYDRMGEQHRTTPLLKDLYAHRKKDWAVATRYLNHLEDMHDEHALYLARRKVAKNFMTAPMFPTGRVLELLDSALTYAMWSQDMAAAYEIIQDILSITKRPQGMITLKADLDRGMQKTEQVLQFLQDKLAEDPTLDSIRREISNVHVVNGDEAKAIAMLTNGLKRNPKSKTLLEARLVLHVKLKDYQNAINDTKRILAMDSLYYNERSDYMEKLSVFYDQLDMDTELESIYHEGVTSDLLSVEDRLYFAAQLDIFYRDRKMMDKISILYEEVLRSDSININEKFDYIDKMIFLYTTNNQPQKIEETYRLALEADNLNPSNRIDLYERFAFFYTRADRPEKVLALYLEAIDSDKLNVQEKVDFFNQLAALYAKRNEPEQVANVFTRAIEMEDLGLDVRIDFVEQLASLYAKHKTMQDVLNVYNDVLAWEDLEQSHRVNMIEQLAFLYTQRKDMAMVEATYREAIDNNDELDAKARIDFVERLAALYSKQQMTERIIPLYTEVLAWDDLEPADRLNMYEQVAFLHSKQRNVAAMERTYREAIDNTDQLDTKARINLAEQLAGYYTKHNASDRVTALYTEMLTWDNMDHEDRISIYETLAYLYTQQKKTADVERVYRSAMAWEAFDADVRVDFAEQLAAILAKAKQYTVVIDVYLEALTFPEMESEKRANLFESLAAAYVTRKQPADAVALYRQAMLSDQLEMKERIFFVEQLAGLYTKMKEGEKVIPLYQEAMAFEDLDMKEKIDLLDQLAFLYGFMKRTDRMIVLYKDALQWEGLDSEQRLSLIEHLAAAYARKKDDVRIIELYTHEINAATLELAERISVMRLLAALFFIKKQFESAEQLHHLALETDPEDAENWQNVIYLLEFQDKIDEEIDLLKNYLSRFPDDTARLQLLVELYLYKKKDLSRMPLYYSFVRTSLNEELAIGVTDALMKVGKSPVTWVLANAPLFPTSAKMPMLAIYSLQKRKDMPGALQFILSLLHRMPRQPKLLAMTALMYASMGDIEHSEDYFTRFDALDVQDADIFFWVGQQAYFAGKHDRAAAYLDAATHRAPNDANAWFWYAEALTVLDRETEGLEALRLAETLLIAKRARTIDQERMLLKIKGRIHFTDLVETLYLAKIQQYPKEMGFYEDLLELLLDKRNIAKATSLIEQYAQAFPKEKKSVTQYRALLAAARRDWARAIAMNQSLLDANPADFGASMALAHAYHQNNQWHQAIETYKHIPILSPEEIQTLAPLNALYKTYGDHLSADFQMGFFGSDNMFVGTSTYDTFLTERMRFESTVVAGQYKAAAVSFSDMAETGQFLLAFPTVRGFAWKAGVGVGHSPRRITPSAFASITYDEPQKYGATLNLKYRELRIDFPQAVAGGILRDTAQLDNHYYLGKRFYLYSRAEAKRNYLPEGPKAYEYFAEPGLTFEILKRPSLNIGYHFTYSHSDLRNGFENAVPLTTDLRTHAVALQFNHDIRRKFFYGASISAGEDTAKKTHLFKGDQLGIGANIRWQITQQLEGKSSYGFGRESVANIAGASHQFGIAFSGHWY